MNWGSAAVWLLMVAALYAFTVSDRPLRDLDALGPLAAALLAIFVAIALERAK